MRTYILLIPAFLAVPALAQKVDLRVVPQKDQTQRFSIESQLQFEQSRKVLVDGEEGGAGGRGARGGGGAGGGESTVVQKVVFDQGADWREYLVLEATEKRPGRDGQPRETKVEGALAKKKLFMRDGGMFDGKGDEAKPVDAALSRGVPGAISIAGFLPGKEVAVGEEFDVSGSFRGALASLMHPVTPQPPERGADRGGDQGGQRGQRGQRGGQMGARAPGGAVTQVLTAAKLDCEATGVIEKVVEKDGKQFAIVALTAKIHGKGTPEELGLGGGFGGGRGGRGGAGAAQGTASAQVELKGKLMFDIASHQIASVELNGDLASDSDTKRTMNRGGQESEMQIQSATKGAIELKASCEPAK